MAHTLCVVVRGYIPKGQLPTLQVASDGYLFKPGVTPPLSLCIVARGYIPKGQLPALQVASDGYLFKSGVTPPPSPDGGYCPEPRRDLWLEKLQQDDQDIILFIVATTNRN